MYVAFAAVAAVLPSGRLAAADPPDVEVKRLTAELEAARKQIELLRKENEKLAEIVKKAVVERQKAVEAAQAAALKVEATKQKLEQLLAELKTDRFGLDRPLHKLDKTPAVPEGARGKVTAFRDGVMSLSIGLDAGLEQGAVLDVYRTEKGGDYLGTVVIQKVYPKEAVGQFRPKDARIPIGRLRPEQLPKAGDEVGKIDANKKP